MMPQGERLLVVAFASAPGLPNWGGLLRKVYDGMAEPAHQCFDTLYVVDPSRSWYHGESLPFVHYKLVLVMQTSLEPAHFPQGCEASS